MLEVGVVAALAAALPAGWQLREENATDLEFLGALYADTRSQEMAAVAWDEATKATFLREQYELQYAHYRKHYLGAHFLALECEGALCGRIYVHESATELRLMDIALVAPERRKGIGAALIHALQTFARTLRKDVTLHVEPDNSAQRLYRRLGFTLIEKRGPYDFLSWPGRG